VAVDENPEKSIVEALTRNKYACVVVGGGIRTHEPLLELFEKVAQDVLDGVPIEELHTAVDLTASLNIILAPDRFVTTTSVVESDIVRVPYTAVWVGGAHAARRTYRQKLRASGVVNSSPASYAGGVTDDASLYLEEKRHRALTELLVTVFGLYRDPVTRHVRTQRRRLLHG
jgi:hypothetical protein